MNANPVLVTREAGVAIITLNRAEAGNTVNMPLAQALLDAAVQCADDKSVHCVVLTGKGRLFCGGGDLSAFSAAGDNLPGYLEQLSAVLHGAVMCLMTISKPVLTIINGPAAGAGLSLAICGDIVLAGKSATFLTAYGSVGLTPDGGMTWLLPRLVGLRRAQDMLIGNRRISAEEAYQIGLVTQVVEDAELHETGMLRAKVLATGPTAAIGATRALLLSGFDKALSEQLATEAASISQAGGSDECRERVAAFLQGRKPTY